MSFLSFLFGPPNPTKKWVADPSVPLVVDLDGHHLCGVGLGEPFERLAFLGPARLDWDFGFPAKGVSVGVEEGRIDSFTIYFNPAATPWFKDGGMASFTGSLRYRGRELTLSEISREDTLLRTFGEPYWRDADDDEVLWFYEFPDREWQLEVSPEGRLRALILGRGCIMADPEQRKAYGVTKPWPPE
jgi:hypothetical protein